LPGDVVTEYKANCTNIWNWTWGKPVFTKVLDDLKTTSGIRLPWRNPRHSESVVRLNLLNRIDTEAKILLILIVSNLPSRSNRPFTNSIVLPHTPRMNDHIYFGLFDINHYYGTI
jgi:hypothetical protein